MALLTGITIAGLSDLTARDQRQVKVTKPIKNALKRSLIGDDLRHDSDGSAVLSRFDTDRGTIEAIRPILREQSPYFDLVDLRPIDIVHHATLSLGSFARSLRIEL